MAVKLQKKNNKVQKIIKKVKPVMSSRAHGSTRQPAVAIDMPKGEYVEAVGRRKTATARVRLYKTAGDFVVNGKAAGQYFNTIPDSHVLYNQPFNVTDTRNQFAVSAIIKGSGARAQIEALIHGIAHALTAIDTTYRPLLKEQGMLTRDDRMKETRKIGTGGKARRKRQSPKR